MAYVFDKLAKEVDDSKEDIFGLTADQGPGQTEAGSQIKTESGFSLSGGSQPSSTPKAPTVQAPPRGETEKRQQTLTRQRSQFPSGLQSLASSLADREQQLGSAKKSYLEGFKQKDYGLNPDTISQALAGDKVAEGKVSGLLTKGTPGAITDTFEVPDVTDPTIGQIQTAGGLEQYLRRQAGPQYSAGEAALDVGSLTRDPAFVQGRAELLRRQKALADRASGLGTTIGGTAQDILESNLSDAQDEARLGISGGISDAIAELVQQRQDEIDAIVGQKNVLAEQQAADAAQGLVDLDPNDYFSDADYLQSLGVDPSEYFDVRDTPVTQAEVLTPELVERFNTLNTLIGAEGDPLTSEAYTDPLTTFDKDAYLAALRDAFSTATTPAPLVDLPPEPIPFETLDMPVPTPVVATKDTGGGFVPAPGTIGDFSGLAGFSGGFGDIGNVSFGGLGGGGFVGGAPINLDVGSVGALPDFDFGMPSYNF